ncbi:glucose-1-phosphate cytidylyltransferase [Thermoflexales bacterium]|nr:glucose-1-phosphate cytidylyltransferase [Thermoflexales bacterium]
MEDIPVVIVCGGQSTRMRAGDADDIKKELVEVGGRPIIWHVMRIFSAHGFNRFILALGYKGDQIRRYFAEYDTMLRDVTLRLAAGERATVPAQIHQQLDHPAWEVTLVDTGLQTDKATRVARVAQYIAGPRFFVAYGDDVSDVDLPALVEFHRMHGKLATITAVQINLQFGVVEADEVGLVDRFVERPRLPYWINGGFMLFERPVLDWMAAGSNVGLETEVLPQLAQDRQLMIYRHTGFWQSLNTFKDTLELENAWQQNPPWKIWAV